MAREIKNTYSVYCHTNRTNGKKYVGVTKRSPEARWGNNGVGYKGQLFYSAIQKYGWDNFDHDILYSGLSEIDAKNKETEIIKYFKTNDRDFGYNLTSGGDGLHNFNPSEETRQKMRENQLGKKNYFYNKRYIGKENHYYGRKHSEYSKHLISKNHADVSGKNNPRARKVICIETGEIFDTATEAGKSMGGISMSSICSCCKGFSKSAGGFHWKYPDDCEVI